MSNTLIKSAEELAVGRPYAERSDHEPRLHDRAAEFLFATLWKPGIEWLHDPARRLEKIVDLVNRHEQALRTTADSQIAAQAKAMRPRLRRSGFTPALVG